MHLFLQMSKLQETTSYFDENVGRVGVKSDTVLYRMFLRSHWSSSGGFKNKLGT